MGNTVCGDEQLFLAYAGRAYETKFHIRFYCAVIRPHETEVSMEIYWKVSEVAAAIQVSEQTIYRYVANGEIPFHKLSRAVRFKPSEIESWMESRKASSMANNNGNIGGEGE
jgi:excisionase family DNA binding protein